MSKVETVRLGNEYDEALRRTLMAVLTELSGHVESTGWALAGSQELENIEVVVGGKQLLIESETYIGLTITGESSLLQEVTKRVTERMKPDPIK